MSKKLPREEVLEKQEELVEETFEVPADELENASGGAAVNMRYGMAPPIAMRYGLPPRPEPVARYGLAPRKPTEDC
jgi:hypothetical protein